MPFQSSGRCGSIAQALLATASCLCTLRRLGAYAFILLAITTALPAESRTDKHRALDSTAELVDEALVNPPIDGEVCFAPDEPCDIKLSKFIRTAQKSIDVAIFDLNLDRLAHDLLVASKKMSVRILVDRRQSKGSHSLVPLLIKAGALVRYGHQRGIMHNKFSIVDGAMIETGSFNYTNHATKANSENQVYVATPVTVERYKKRFEEIWKMGVSAK